MPIGNNTSGHLFDTSFTTNGPLYSAASGVLTSGAAGSAGQVYQSAGAGAPPAYSTATYPTTATATGKILRADGTNWAATTATYPDTAGSAGKILISDGTNIVSSTPTYPNASPAAGKILIGDGTNYVASTPTYPNTAGTTGAVLQSDGTNFVEGNIFYKSIPLTNAQIKALHGTPVQVVAALGAGKVVNIISCSGKMLYGGTNVFVAGAAQTIALYYGTGTAIANVITNAGVVLAASNWNTLNPTVVNQTKTTGVIDNIAINLYNPVATEITGNAANDNTILITVVYSVMTL